MLSVLLKGDAELATGVRGTDPSTIPGVSN